MILLISGVSGSGKTLLAQKLLERYKIPYLSLDHLKMGLYRADRDCGFTPQDSTEHIGKTLWPIVRGIMMTTIENEQHLILEGSYLLPRYIKDVSEDYPGEIIPVCLGFSLDYIEKNFESKIIKYRDVIERRKFAEERSKKEMTQEHKDFKEECRNAEVRYFEIGNDYEKEMLQILHSIEDEIQKKGFNF